MTTHSPPLTSPRVQVQTKVGMGVGFEYAITAGRKERDRLVRVTVRMGGKESLSTLVEKVALPLVLAYIHIHILLTMYVHIHIHIRSNPEPNNPNCRPNRSHVYQTQQLHQFPLVSHRSRCAHM